MYLDGYRTQRDTTGEFNQPLYKYDKIFMNRDIHRGLFLTQPATQQTAQPQVQKP
jgi:hypothetical protein